ncbi:unnamed protein product, partial [marine sediment metagenome]
YLQKNWDVGVVYCNGYCINEKGKVLYKIFPENHVEQNNPERLLLDCYFNLPSNSLIRRNAIEKAGPFDEALRSAQDHDMAIRLAEVTRLAYIDEPLWYYRRHPSSQSGLHAKRRWQAGFTILEKACKRYPYPKKICRKRKSVLNFRMGQCFLEEKKNLNALIHFLKAGILDPIRSLKVISGKEKISSPHS